MYTTKRRELPTTIPKVRTGNSPYPNASFPSLARTPAAVASVDAVMPCGLDEQCMGLRRAWKHVLGRLHAIGRFYDECLSVSKALLAPNTGDTSYWRWQVLVRLCCKYHLLQDLVMIRSVKNSRDSSFLRQRQESLDNDKLQVTQPRHPRWPYQVSKADAGIPFTCKSPPCQRLCTVGRTDGLHMHERLPLQARPSACHALIKLPSSPALANHSATHTAQK